MSSAGKSLRPPEEARAAHAAEGRQMVLRMTAWHAGGLALALFGWVIGPWVLVPIGSIFGVMFGWVFVVGKRASIGEYMLRGPPALLRELRDRVGLPGSTTEALPPA